jgi:hypothetical protein
MLATGCTSGATYVCLGDNGHCYGTINWYLPNTGFDVLTSAFVTLDTPQMVAGDGHTSDELWFAQDHCLGGGNETSRWVEVGGGRVQ